LRRTHDISGLKSAFSPYFIPGDKLFNIIRTFIVWFPAAA
jgi:hypothetical protein